MKKILGLDLGTNSIGWAYVIEDENYENSEIKQIGVRVNPLTVDEQSNFEKGKSFSVNQERTLKRGARRNLDRYQDRRKKLIELLTKNKIINENTLLTEVGKNTTHNTWTIRAKAACERIELEEFARVLLAINKKRGYKSSRKAKNEEDGQAIDGMSIAIKLYDENLTPGQFVFQMLKEGKKTIPDFYRSDLQNELAAIWNFQKQFHQNILTDNFFKEIAGKGQRATSALFWTTYGFNTADIKDIEEELKTEKTEKLNLRDKKKLQAYKWRSDAISRQLNQEELAYVITEINNNLHNSSGYLGAISDRSKELYFNKLTVGQYLFKRLEKNAHNSLKNQVFYRQDYLDEFEKIWETQAKYYPQLTTNLKKEIRDVIIFYQRKLKSQKGLVSFCELENKEIEIEKNGKKEMKIVGSRVAPKSSPLFQEFKIWQNLSNVIIRKKGAKKNKVENEIFNLDSEAKQLLFEELNLKGNLTSNKIFKILNYNPQDWEMNYTQLEGNRTNKELYKAYLQILDLEGYEVKELLQVKSNKDEVELDDLTVPALEIKNMISSIFEVLKINTKILDFNAELNKEDFEFQASYQLWHLLYSYEGDDSPSGNERLYKLLETKFGFNREHAKILANVNFQDDYGALSSKAMRNIYPHIKENNYSTACELAGYRHSKHSLTTEELEHRQLKPRLELLKKNSLRQPVVEKILNQMINVVNTIIDKENDKLETEGKERNFHFDEIRIELARELKKNAKEREELTKGINRAKSENEKINKILQKEFGVKNPTRNDIIRYKLYEELKPNSYKDLYTNTYIPREYLFNKQIDIEHIIPQSRLFDNSFSNKTIVYRQENLKKGNDTAYDHIKNSYGEEKVNDYVQRVQSLYELSLKNKEEGISKAKYKKLLMQGEEIGDGFIERDLRETQYIAKKAKEILFEITPSVLSTSGNITNRLREDWNLINIMKELNLPKYRELGLTEMEERKFGQEVEVIKDWTKRNDHRHHAMDALTIAFTKRSHIQYLNNLNARRNDYKGETIANSDKEKSISSSDLKIRTRDVLGIEEKETIVRVDDSGNKKRVFKEPMPNFRQVAKQHLENVIVSHKAKNKVVTKNINRAKNHVVSVVKDEYGKERTIKGQVVKTPRGQLHNETIYGMYHYYETKEVAVNASLTKEIVQKVSNVKYKEVLLKRLEENNDDPKKAFAGKNAISKTPIFIDEKNNIKVPNKIFISWLEKNYSIRKDITPENFKDEKLIDKIIDIKIKTILKERLKEFEGDAKKAFSDLDKNPVWLNKEKGISIKRVTITGVKNAEALRDKKDHLGNFILDEHGNKQAVDFVSTSNNHHVAVYRDDEGNLQENVISFYEAVARVNAGLPIIDKDYNHHLGWQFLFTMKQNELFVFPNEKTGFNPSEIDLLDPKNKQLISPNLFRVQKIGSLSSGFWFRHHCETTVNTSTSLKEITYKVVQSTKKLENITKVRTNHLGDIIQVGEY